MDYAACNVVYVDRAAREDRLVKSDDPTLAHLKSSNGEVIAPVLGKTGFVDGNLHTLLETFSEVYICSSGESCISKLSELNKTTVVDLIPTLVLVDIPYDDDELEEPLSRDFRTPSPNSRQEVDETNENQTVQSIYGIDLLQWLAGEIKYQSLSRLFVPVAVVAIPHHSSRTRERTHTRSRSALSDQDPFGANPRKTSVLSMPLDQIRTMKYLDVGAVDVLTSPLLRERLPSLAIHAYRSHKDALKDQEALLEMKRGRKRSWVGLDDQKPYAYLREAMVSGLMDGICKLGGEDEPFAHVRITVALNAREKIADSIGTWDFSAHEFTDDELLHAALLMLQHALTMPQLEQWRISTEQLTGFLVASRSAYNAFVPYHNFRHVVDVLQAVFYFLVQLGRLPPYPSESASEKIPLSPLAELIRPFDALTLLITAIGHDVGHPGVNNAFLVTLNAPLAQLYNDRSVLESFHCAAYSQILRRHWSAAFQGVEMRKLMIDSILATDMGLHFDYMQKLGFLQDKLHANGGTDGFNVRTLDEQRTLACSLLIKCADISNVARKYHVAEQWTMILTDEFARQASMETDLGIPSALFAAPVREIIELGKSQINFMNMFAIPLFQGVTDVMPAMGFCVDELERNKVEWEQKIAAEQAARQDRQDSIAIDGAFSPRNMSLATPSDVTSSRRVGSVTATVVSNPESHQRIRALLSQTSFPGNRETSGSPVESLQEDPEESPSSSVGASPSELLALPKTSVQRRSSKPLPSQLQLSYATASAPASLGQPSGVENQNGSHGTIVNGLSVQPSLVTDAVIADTPMSSAETVKESHQQRGSETTNGSAATSATTGNMPLSPSTKATSIMSHDESERGKSSSGQTARKGMLCTSNNSQNSGSTAGAESFEGYDAKQMSADAAKKLTKKPSRFRLPNFFKRNKSPSPAIPSGADGRTTMNGETEDAYTA